MLTANFSTKNGSGMIIGLDKTNLDKLLANQPIMMEKPRIPDNLECLMIIGGEDLKTIIADNGLEKFVTPSTEIQDNMNVLGDKPNEKHVPANEGSESTS